MINSNFKIALACGGTGGHISPALAVKDEFKKIGINSIFLTDIRGSKSINSNFIHIINSGSPSISGFKKFYNILKIFFGVLQSIYFLNRNKIKLVIGFGGYTSVPIILAAWLLKIPTIIHEQNKVMGRANRFCSYFSRKIALSFDILNDEKFLNKVVITGNPVRQKISMIGLKEYSPNKNKHIKLLIIGGSQGARIFSKLIPEAIQILPIEIKEKLFIYQQSRFEDSITLTNYYKKIGICAEIKVFFKNIDKYYEDCNLIISRSGASTISEISAIGRPSILIPLASSLDDHQSKNAQELVSSKAAVLINEKDLSASLLSDNLLKILNSPSIMIEMANNAKASFIKDAAKKIVDLGLSQFKGSANE